MGGRAGDWPCPNPECINSTKMVFQKYSSCPKCGSPPEGVLMQMETRGAPPRPGDWACPNPSCVNSVKMVFGKNLSCPKCGAPKPAGGGFGGGYRGSHGVGYPTPRLMPNIPMRPAPQFKPAPQFERGGSAAGGDENAREEDWQCSRPDCINHTKLVFGKHSACPSCGTSKNADRPGDWQCPNPQCQNHRNSVFAKHTFCPKCKTPRPSKGRIGGPALMPLMPVAPMPAPMPRSMPRSMSMPMMSLSPAPPMRMSSGGRSNAPGDWQCPNRGCINHTKLVFGKNDDCPKCGSLKGAGNANDWRCPNQGCVNHTKLVFAKHDSCPKCGEARPENGSRARSRSPYGLRSL